LDKALLNFYKYEPPRKLEEIYAELKELEAEIAGLKRGRLLFFKIGKSDHGVAEFQPPGC